LGGRSRLVREGSRVCTDFGASGPLVTRNPMSLWFGTVQQGAFHIY
jgi:hypothetical protein